MLKVLHLPSDFGALLHLGSKPPFTEYFRWLRIDDRLFARVDLGDFTEDDVLVAVTNNIVVIIGSRRPASFCLHLNVPPDGAIHELETRISGGVLELSMPLRPTGQSETATAS